MLSEPGPLPAQCQYKTEILFCRVKRLWEWIALMICMVRMAEARKAWATLKVPQAILKQSFVSRSTKFSVCLLGATEACPGDPEEEEFKRLLDEAMGLPDDALANDAVTGHGDRASSSAPPDFLWPEEFLNS